MPAKADKRLNLTREDDTAWMKFLHERAARLRREQGVTQLQRLTIELDEFPSDDLTLLHWPSSFAARQEVVHSESLRGARLQGTVDDVNTVNLTLLLANGAEVRIESSNTASFYKLRFFVIKQPAVCV